MFAALLFPCVFLSAEPLVQTTPHSPPNVLLIISDDQAWTDFGFMGHPHIRTPRLDRLAGEGLTFTHGYVPSSLCSPSLATIISGLYPHQHKVTSNDPPRPGGNRRPGTPADPSLRAGRRQLVSFFEQMPALPRLLEPLGYRSLQTGKWWGGSFRTAGFTDGMSQGDPEKGGRHGDAGLAIGRETLAPVLDFIDASQEQKSPFFVWYAPFLPHSPHNPPERLLAHYRNLAPSLQHAKYWAMCEWLDETCGTLLDALDERGLADDTLVLFVVDNGWIQDPEADRYAPRSKQSPYDGGLRTPILIRWPGHTSPARIATPVSSIDIAPTILAAAGQPALPVMQGLNLLDLEAVAARPAIFGECFTHNAVDLNRPAASLRQRWVVSHGWKLIEPDATNEPDAKTELYQIQNDPFETFNRALDEPARVEALRDQLDAWWPAVTTPARH